MCQRKAAKVLMVVNALYSSVSQFYVLFYPVVEDNEML